MIVKGLRRRLSQKINRSTVFDARALAGFLKFCFAQFEWFTAAFDSSAPQLFFTADSVTKLGDLLDFGQLFKAFGNN